jgi:diguanylate cyclase (GGDEF)-like protein
MTISTRQSIIEKHNLKGEPDSELYELVSSVANFFEMAISTISISLADNVIFHAAYGISKSSIAAEDAFSTHVTNNQTPLIVEDLTKNHAFANNPMVNDAPFLRFFAGMPLIIEGVTIGAFCLIDTRPRKLTTEQFAILKLCRDFIVQHIQLAHKYKQQQDKQKLNEAYKKQSQLLRFVNKAHTAYLQNHDLPDACQQILPELVEIADCQFAFIGQLVVEGNQRRLFLHAVTEMNWGKVSKVWLQLYRERNLYFDSFDNLFGEVIKTADIVISNEENTHKASKGTPSGHPPIKRFLGLPIKVNNQLFGMIGLANKKKPYTLKDAEFLQPLLESLGGLFYAVDQEKARAKAENKLKQMAMTDALSGLNNRRAFMEHCRTIDKSSNLIFAMIDIDHFKQVNDTYGHAAGDNVIKVLGATMQEVVGSKHFLSRMGGEEFSVLLQDMTPENVHDLLHKLKNTIKDTPIVTGDDGHIINITISIGVSAYSHELEAADTAIIQADKALYKAKKNGKDRVEWFDNVDLMEI